MTAQKINLRDFDPAQDTDRLQEWLQRPHVKKWWSMQEAEELFACDSNSDAIIETEGIAVGYLCWEFPPLQDLEEAGLSDLPEGLIDIDILIGEPDLLGQGIGPRALDLLIKRLRGEHNVMYAGLAASVSNKRAKRAYEKAGFELFREFDDPESGPCYYLIREVDSDHLRRNAL